MIFLYPKAFLLLFLIPILIIYVRRYRAKFDIFNQTTLDKLRVKAKYPKIKFFIAILILILLIVALARPVIKKEQIVTESSTQIEILLNVSNSMKKNLKPNFSRFDLAREKIISYVEQNRANRYALSIFAKGILNITPLTKDIDIFIDSLKAIDFNLIDIDEIDIIELQKYKSKYSVIVVTDKELKNIDFKVANLNSDFKFNFGQSEIDSIENRNYKELFYFPVVVAIFLFFTINISISNIWILLLLLPLSDAKAFDFIYLKNYKEAMQSQNIDLAIKNLKEIDSNRARYNLANLYYEKKEYNLAIFEYKNIKSRDRVFKSKVFFNLGNCYFKIKKYKSAKKAYKNALLLHFDRDYLINYDIADSISPAKKVVKREKKRFSKLEQRLYKKLGSNRKILSFKEYQKLNGEN